MLFLTFRNTSKIKKFSYNLVVCNSHNKAIRKIGKLFYSTTFKRFILYVDLILLYLLFRKGVRFDQFFFSVCSKLLNLRTNKGIYQFSKSFRILA